MNLHIILYRSFGFQAKRVKIAKIDSIGFKGIKRALMEG